MLNSLPSIGFFTNNGKIVAGGFGWVCISFGLRCQFVLVCLQWIVCYIDRSFILYLLKLDKLFANFLLKSPFFYLCFEDLKLGLNGIGSKFRDVVCGSFVTFAVCKNSFCCLD